MPENFAYFVSMSKTKVHYQKKQPAIADGKVAVAAKVDQDSYDNCAAIATEKEWSLSQVINKAMKAFKLPSNE
jgi:hypothetical protein